MLLKESSALESVNAYSPIAPTVDTRDPKPPKAAVEVLPANLAIPLPHLSARL